MISVREAGNILYCSETGIHMCSMRLCFCDLYQVVIFCLYSAFYNIHFIKQSMFTMKKNMQQSLVE